MSPRVLLSLLPPLPSVHETPSLFLGDTLIPGDSVRLNEGKCCCWYRSAWVLQKHSLHHAKIFQRTPELHWSKGTTRPTRLLHVWPTVGPQHGSPSPGSLIKKTDERIGKGDSVPGMAVQPAGRGCRSGARRITGAAAGHMTGSLRPAPPAFPAQSLVAATTAARVAGELHRPASPLCALPAPPQLLQPKKAKPRRLRDPRSRRLRAPRAVLAPHPPPRADSRAVRTARAAAEPAPGGRGSCRAPGSFGWLLRGLGGGSFPLAIGSLAPVREPRAVWADAASTRRGHCPCCF